MISKSKGRPQKVSDNELRKMLVEYSSDYLGKVTYLGLERETGIKRHVWSRRMSKEIDRLNEPLISYTDNDDKLPLPNIELIVEQHFENKKHLVQALSHINDVVQALYDQNLTLKNKNHSLEEKLEQQTDKNKKLDQTIKEYEEIIVGSAYGVVRKDKKIKKNLVSIEAQNEVAATSLNFKKMFPNIFN
ncbi:hypothetical protein [Priestia aryabhattai]|uniref:hypothetical protein n=1 Tax=Priestia aryabhattai TaxID=412384 RepID=UPI0023AF7AED|nr:hypothetical protein [Priestia aryabhattai]MDE8674456.1 hypothetical protein [Priestia aryabhattai]